MRQHETRRRTRRIRCAPGELSGAVVALVMAALPACAQTSPDGAAMFRGGPDHTGVYDAPMLSGFGGLGWRVQTRGTVRSRPTVQGATVYVGSGDGHLYAIDRESGETRWAFDAGSAVTSTPAVSGGLVFFGTYDDDFHAVWAADGRPVWTLETGPPLPFP